MMTRYILSALLVVALSISSVSGSEVYQWRDEAGRLHYGDRAGHPEARSRVIGPSTIIAPDSARLSAKQKLLDVLTQERLAEKQQAAQRKAEKKRREQQCADMKKELWQLEHAHVVYYQTDDAGNREYESDSDRTERAKEFRSRYEELCH